MKIQQRVLGHTSQSLVSLNHSMAKITGIKLTTQAKVPGIDPAKFDEVAQATKAGCPVSQALSAVPMELDAKLI